MSDILFQYYRVNPTTWVYLSSLLMIGLFFKFGRFWSVRNLDLVWLILLAPGLLISQYGSEAKIRVERLAAIEARREAVPNQPPSADAERLSTALEEAAAGAEELETAAATEQPSVSGDMTATRAATIVGASGEPLGTADLLLLAEKARGTERLGFLWLFAVGGAVLVRMLLDPTMVRRPLLDPNLTAGGLTFIGASLLVFLMANVWNSKSLQVNPIDEEVVEQLTGETEELLKSAAVIGRSGPGYAVLNTIPSIPTMTLVPDAVEANPQQRTRIVIAKTIAILGHLAVVLGLVAIGFLHFGNTKTGVGVATLYLMLPYTAQMTGHIDHVIPAALLVWAVLCYRRPLTAGTLIGLATALVYYPLFLVPLWVSFYWRRGLMRFVTGVVLMLVVMAIALAFVPHASYWENLKQMFGLWLPMREGLEGIWDLGWEPLYRIPVLAAFIAMSGTLSLWPAQKNLGTLLSCSAAVMVGTQFWHGFGGGLYMGWYLPLALLTVFRPNLEDRVALAVLGEGWVSRRNNGYTDGIKVA